MGLNEWVQRLTHAALADPAHPNNHLLNVFFSRLLVTFGPPVKLDPRDVAESCTVTELMSAALPNLDSSARRLVDKAINTVLAYTSGTPEIDS